MRKLDLSELKKEYIGKVYFWLTITDIFRDERHRIRFRCICKCGKECSKDFRKVISGHTSSCGCFKFTKDYSDKLKDVWSTKPDVVQKRSEDFKQWCKDNPDKVKAKSEKRKLTYATTDAMERQQKNRAKTFRENPEIQKNINIKLKQYWSDKDRLKELSNKCKLKYIQDPTLSKRVSDSLKEYYSDPENRKRQSEIVKEYCRNNPDKVAEVGKKKSARCKAERLNLINQVKDSDDFKQLLSAMHPSYIEDILSAKIKCSDQVLTKCILCGEYDSHAFGNIWHSQCKTFRATHLPYCSKCRSQLVTSSYESEIAGYISTFHSGELIRNSRDIISPLELDIYYPEKKIAIEFNGDYFHSTEFKSKDYHYNKFKYCREKDILLVSIFERYWNSDKEIIKLYLKDLFNNVENNLSFSDNKMSNNYPSLKHFKECNNYIEESYPLGNHKVYTCGYSEISIS